MISRLVTRGTNEWKFMLSPLPKQTSRFWPFAELGRILALPPKLQRPVILTLSPTKGKNLSTDCKLNIQAIARPFAALSRNDAVGNGNGPLTRARRSAPGLSPGGARRDALAGDPASTHKLCVLCASVVQ